MRFIFIALTILISVSAFPQKIQKIDAILLKKDSKDTLNVKIKVSANLFDKTLLNEGSFCRNLIVIDTNDKTWPEEKWLKPKELDYLEFIDFKGKTRIFVARQDTGPLSKMDPLNKSLFEELFVGEISWYRQYSLNAYDSSTHESDYFIKKDKKKPIFIHLFTSHKKQLLKLAKDMPKLEPMIQALNNSDFDYDILEILKAYDDFKSNSI
ncbi:hypothetical protein HNS38_15610 [Lentimicrobium sp. L6]|uniref:hypothetical protein n=1 Tax=Lentimicrobium sp. L6 TaxID=2735916 RepID=UPI001555E01C|nr:hypothetical protein [Lentimicrobium sp. L6]NPD86200.1 hypothetical protein [Lentimicrobium sp. L6]